MPWRISRPRALILLLVTAGLALAALAVTSRAGAAVHGGAARGVIRRCVRLAEGQGRVPARGVPGSTDPQVTAALSILRAPRTAADALPAARSVARALAAADVATFDPSASRRLDIGSRASGRVYAVPAMLVAPALPARCAHLRALAGPRAALALQNQETGTGPGICLLTTQVAMTGPPEPILPGRRRARERQQTLASAGCESLSAMASYLGAFGGGLSHLGLRVAILPDGVGSVTYVFSDGRRVTAAVHGNLLALPVPLGGPLRLRHPTLAQLRRAFAARAPVSITENGTSGAAPATYPRPPGLIGEYVRLAALLRRSLVSGAGSENVLASCSARTHRCVAVVISLSCRTGSHRCRATRRIHRYRYVGARPPRGTTGPVVVPTAPIRARLNRYLTRPGKLSLVLSGAPHRRVDVIVSVACFSGSRVRSVTGMFGPPLQMAVPSRTRLTLPRRHQACDVNVFVVSGQRGTVRARLRRG